MTQTTKCVRCGKPANRWTGHVVKANGEHVLAGWCSKDCREIIAGEFQGYCGKLIWKHGEEECE